MNNARTIAWLTFHEALRRRMVLAGGLLGVLFLLLYNGGLLLTLNSATDVAGLSGPAMQGMALNFLVTAGLNVVHFLAIGLAIFASVDTVAGEIRSHTIQALATKPVRRWEIILGKWLGFALMIVPYVIVLAGGIILSVYLFSGYLAPNVPQVIGLLVLQSLLLLSLSLLIGTRVSTLTNGVILFMLYGLAYIGSWIEQIGALVNAPAAVNLGIVTSLFMPVEALWRLAVGQMSPPMLSYDSRLSILFGGGSQPSVVMVIYACAFVLAALALAMRQFSLRDL